MTSGSLELTRDLALLIGSLEPEALDTKFDPEGIFYENDFTGEDRDRPIVALIRHGRDDQRPPKVPREPPTEQAEFTKDVSQFAALLRATTNPDITSPESLQHCEDTGFKLADFLTKGGITADQLVFLSSPSNRAMTTCSRVKSGFERFYASRDESGEFVVSEWQPSILVVDELREWLMYDQREWRAQKSEIARRYPTADVSRLEDTDPAQQGDLHLEPDADTKLTAEEFLALNRGIIESDVDFEKRVDTVKEILGQVIQSQRERTGKQPVLIATSHCLFINQFLNGWDQVDGRVVRHNAQCHVGSYSWTPATTEDGPGENMSSSASA